MNEMRTRERVGVWIALIAALVMAALVLVSGGCPDAAREVMAAPAAQSLAGVVVLEDGTTAYDEDAESDYLVNRYYSEVALFLYMDVSETTSIVPTVQHSPDGVTWYDGTAFTTVTVDSTGYQMLRTPFYGEYMRVAFDMTGAHEYTPTLKLVPQRACDRVVTEVLDDGGTSYTADHYSDYRVARTGIVDLFLSVEVNETTSIVPTVQHSPDGTTWYDGTAFTTVTEDSTGYDLVRVPLLGEYVRVEWDGGGTVEYTPTIKAVFHEGCGLSAYEELRADLFLANDEGGDLLTRTQADARFLNATGDTMTGALNSTVTNAAGGSANPFDWSATAGIMNGSDNLTIWDINLTNANHTGVSNVVTAIDIGGITGDADATETAISVGTGWDQAATLLGPVTVGADGTGHDVLFYSDTEGDYFQWDQDAEALNIIGTNGQDALVVSDGNANIADALTVGGVATLSGNVDLNGTTLYLGADQGQYIDELADDVVVWQMGAATGVAQFLTGNVIVGNGSPGVAQDGEDLYVEGALEVDGTLYADGSVDIDGTTTMRSDVTVGAVTDGGNLGAKNEITGLPRVKLVGLAQGTNPGSETVDCMDATPDGEWTEVDAGTNLVITADTSYYRYDTNSVKLAVSTVAENDGVSVALPAQDSLADLESIGFWIYSDVAIASGDLDLTVDDSDGTDQVYAIGAVSADVWTWLEVDISGCDANCDTTDNFIILFTAQGLANLGSETPNIYFDELFYWDSADEEALGTAILRDGVLSVIDTEGGATLAEYTDYIVHEESGVDFLVWITDQSTADLVAMVAY